MSAAARRKLALATEDDALAEIDRLRRADYHQTGNWTLAQMAWHLVLPIDKFLVPAAPDAKPTPEQAAAKARFVDVIIATGQPPDYAKQAPPASTPPATANDADIDRFIAGLHKLKTFPHAQVEMGPCGPVSLDECRKVHLWHTAHHLSFLEPVVRRNPLRFKGPDEVIEDVSLLRRGYKRAASWSLPKACWHLNTAVNFVSRPGPHPDPGPMPPAARQMLERILETGQIPPGMPAPERALPPDTCSDSDIDTFIATLQRIKTFPGPFAPHPLYGKLTDDQMRQLILIHSAHHLSQLVPNAQS